MICITDTKAEVINYAEIIPDPTMQDIWWLIFSKIKLLFPIQLYYRKDIMHIFFLLIYLFQIFNTHFLYLVIC